MSSNRKDNSKMLALFVPSGQSVATLQFEQQTEKHNDSQKDIKNSNLKNTEATSLSSEGRTYYHHACI